MAAKAVAADCLLVAAAREEAVAVASVMATVLPVDLAYAKEMATAGVQVCRGRVGVAQCCVSMLVSTNLCCLFY